MIYEQPKKTLLQFPGLWLPGSPLPGALDFARRCCCPSEGCQGCLDDHPTEFEVALPNLLNSECKACQALATGGPYTLSYTADQIVEGSCQWNYNFYSNPCEAHQLILTISEEGEIDVYLRFSSHGWYLGSVHWHLAATDPKPDCDALEDYEIPFWRNYHFTTCPFIYCTGDPNWMCRGQASGPVLITAL